MIFLNFFHFRGISYNIPVLIATQNHNEISSHTCQDDYYKKKKGTNVSQDLRERKHLYIVSGNINSSRYYGKPYKGSSKSKKRTTTRLSNLTSVYVSKGMKSISQRDICALMFIAALFSITQIWNQPNYPSINEQIKRMSYAYNVILFSTPKNKEILTFEQHGGHYAR